jgi:hypothetical protein
MRPTPGVECRVFAMGTADFVAGQFTTLSRLSTLGHLDLELISISQVVAGDTKATRGNLLDCRSHCIAILYRRLRSGSSPPSPVLDLPPSRFMATAKVWSGIPWKWIRKTWRQ